MTEYQALVAYIGVTLVVFAGAIIWNKWRNVVKKRFHLLNYPPKGGDPKTPHPV
jgi:hypothetical protein